MSSLVTVPFIKLKLLHSTDPDSSHINNNTIQTLQQKIVVMLFYKICFPTHSEGDLFDVFELESEGLPENVIDCVPVMKVTCHDQRSL